MEIFKLFGSIVIKDEEALKKLDSIDKKGSGVGKTFDKMRQAGEKITSVGKSLTMGLTVPLAGVAVASAKTAMDFDAGMREVSAISGATGKDLEKLSQLAKDMGSSTKFSATESAEALTYMGMAGWKTQDMMDGLPGILSLAAAGGTDLATTSDIVTDGLTGMGLSAKDTQGFVDIMAATCSNANTSVELMGETLKYAGPVAGALGIEMDDLSLAIGLMGNAGIKGSQAGTALRGGLTNLVKPSNDAAKAMEKYGVEVIKTEGGSVDFMGTMENLRSKLGTLDETTQANALATIFGKEAMSGWASVINASEEDFNKLNTAILESNGKANEMADTMMGGAKGALTEMKSALEGVAITIGERMLPHIEKAADFISKLCTGFQNLSPEMQNVILIVGGLLAALGPVLMILGMLVSFVGNVGLAFTTFAPIVANAGGVVAFLTGGLSGLISIMGSVLVPIIAVVGVIGIFVAAIVKAYNENESFRNKVNEVFSQIQSIISNVMSIVKDVISMAWGLIKVVWNNGLSQILGLAASILTSIVGFFTSKLNTATSVVKTAIALIRAIFSGDFQGAVNIVNTVLQKIVNGFNEKMESAKNKVNNAIQKIKSFFNFSWSLPKLKLPHVNISGKFSLNPPSVPKFGIEWYKNGGVMMNPTMFGFNPQSGKSMVGGEAGPEAILPLSKIPELMEKMGYLNKGGKEPIIVTLNIDGREFMRAVAQYKDELDSHDYRNPKFAY